MNQTNGHDTTYKKYGELLLQRDHLRVEAEQYHREFLKVFGELIIEKFQKKVECIQKEKSFEYCQKHIDAGKKIDVCKLNTYMMQEMIKHQKTLDDIILGVSTARESELVDEEDMEMIQKIYFRMDHLVHSPKRPGLADDDMIRKFWKKLVVAYTYNRREDLEELEHRLAEYLKQNDCHEPQLQDEELANKISKVEDEIDRIKTTIPFIYRTILGDDLQEQIKRQEYQREIEALELRIAQYNEKLVMFEMEQKLS